MGKPFLNPQPLRALLVFVTRDALAALLCSISLLGYVPGLEGDEMQVDASDHPRPNILEEGVLSGRGDNRTKHSSGESR